MTDGSVRREPGRSVGAVLALASAGMLAVGVGGLISLGRPAVGVGLAVAIAGLALLWTRPTALVIAFAVFGVLVASVRRLVDYIVEPDAGLAAFAALPMLTAAALIWAMRSWKGRPLDAVDGGVIALMILAVLAAFNPLAGELTLSLLGIPLLLMPLLWYWVGRALVGRDDLIRLGWVVAALGVPVAAFGVAQAYGHHTAFDLAWADRASFDSLRLGAENVRAIGTLASPAEFSRLLAVSILLWVILPLPRRWLPVRLAALALLATALWLSGVRSAVILTGLGLVALLLSSRMLTWRHKAVIALLGVLALGLILQAEGTPSGRVPEARTAAEVASSRQAVGLASPFGGEETGDGLAGRIRETSSAVTGTIERPIGVGTLSITRAVARADNIDYLGDGDVTRIASALGVPGLLALGLVLVAGFRRYRVVDRDGDRTVASITLVFAAGALLSWMDPGFYVISSLVWVSIGAMVTEYTKVVAGRDGIGD